MRADSLVVWARARVSSASCSRSAWTLDAGLLGGGRGGVDLVADALDRAMTPAAARAAGVTRRSVMIRVCFSSAETPMAWRSM
jgi:hypothetical protein